MGKADLDPDLVAVVERARRGSKEDLGRLLEWVRPVAERKARVLLRPSLQAKADSSDLLQETFLEVQKGIQEFQGHSGEEFLAWIIRILLHKALNFQRQYGPGTKRDIGREVSLDDNAVMKALDM